MRLNPTKLRIRQVVLLDVRAKGNNADHTDRKMIEVPEENGRGKQSVVIALIDDVVWIVLAQREESLLWHSQKLAVSNVDLVDYGSKRQRVYVNEGDGDEPEKGEGVELEVGEKSEAQHFEEGLVLGFHFFVEKAASEGGLVLE